MSTQDIADELQHYLKLYSIKQNEQYLTGILTFAGMLVGKVQK